MSKYLPKAERMFQQKLKTALAPQGYIYVIGDALDYEAFPGDDDLYDGEMLIRHWSTDCFDFNYIAELFSQYGAYLLLIEDDNDVSVEVDASPS